MLDAAFADAMPLAISLLPFRRHYADASRHADARDIICFALRLFHLVTSFILPPILLSTAFISDAACFRYCFAFRHYCFHYISFCYASPATRYASLSFSHFAELFRCHISPTPQLARRCCYVMTLMPDITLPTCHASCRCRHCLPPPCRPFSSPFSSLSILLITLALRCRLLLLFLSPRLFSCHDFAAFAF